jgi:Ca2+-binding RTX toxin-like protein
LQGSLGADSLNGGKGDDTLATSKGKDTLVGGTGKDNFLYSDQPDSFKYFNTIKDFKAGDDRISLRDQISLRELGHTGSLTETEFKTGLSATDSAQRIIYDNVNGYLFYDPDGNGSAEQKILFKLSPGLSLSHSDIVIV